MKNKDEWREELDGFSPFLKKMKDRDEGFKVPPDYFKSLPDEVMKKAAPERPANRTWADALAALVQRYWQPGYALALATAAVLVVAAVCMLNKDKKTEAPWPVAQALLNEIPDETLQHYISDNIGDFDKALILETHFAGKEAGLVPKFDPVPSDGELDQYLDEIIEAIDLDDLL